jgi:hypothetical protein
MNRTIQQILLIVLITASPSLFFSQSVEEIITNHIDAHGGASAWDKVQALEIHANFTAFSIEKPLHAYKTRSGMYYAALNLGEFSVFEAFDGTNGWTIDPWQDIFHARKLNKAEQNVFFQKAALCTPFYRYKEHGHTVEYKGKESIDGMELLVLELTRSNGKKESWYLDPETYLEYLCVSEWVDFGWPNQAETFFDDFREVQGLIIPFYIDRTFGQRNRILEIQKITLNPQIDLSIFEMPRKEELEKLSFMEGEWEVTVEVMTRRGTWYPVGSYPSKIQFKSPTNMEEFFEYERILPISKTTSYTFHDQSKKYRISIFNELSASLELFEGAFDNSNFVFDNSGITIDGLADKNYLRGEIVKLENGGFTLTMQSSSDKGKTWNPTDKFTYTKRME